MDWLNNLIGNRRTKNYGLRQDGTPKGEGYFGELQRPGGGISTELSIGVDGQQIPSLVQTLSKRDIQYLLTGGEPTQDIVQKAILHAQDRRKQNKSPFYQMGEARPYGY